MASSINTNSGAATALQSLQMTQRNLQETQGRIATGLKVGSAKDNAATWTVATVIRTDVANYKQVSENLSTGSSIVSTAQAGAEQVASLISQVKAKVTSAQDPANAANATQIQADIDALTTQIDNTVKSSSFNGVNLLDGSVNDGAGALAKKDFLSSVDKNAAGASVSNYISVSAVNLSTKAATAAAPVGDMNALVVAGNTIATAVTTPTKANYDAALGTLDTALSKATAAAASFGTAAKQIDTQKVFVDKLTDTLTTGVGALVDADMSQEAARLQALQVQQQLGTQALSIANQAPQSILSLFR